MQKAPRGHAFAMNKEVNEVFGRDAFMSSAIVQKLKINDGDAIRFTLAESRTTGYPQVLLIKMVREQRIPDKDQI